jgi:hypothetical protein
MGNSERSSTLGARLMNHRRAPKEHQRAPAVHVPASAPEIA